jgi:radial spoke head protein 1
LQLFSNQEYAGDRNADGKRDGIGRAIFPNRDQYEGDFRKGLRDGYGVYQFRNGARYDGDWKRGVKHGKGKFTYPDGSTYWGDWKRDMKHGFGKYLYDNGDVYEGTWVNDVKHGVGSYKYSEVELTVKGTWIEGFLKGPIEIIHSNYRYHGYWNGSHPVGEGVFTFDMKVSLPGHIAFYTNGSKATSVNSSDVDPSGIATEQSAPCLPEFVAHNIEPYSYSKLPQHPFPLPTTDSASTIATESSKSDVDVPMLITADLISDNEEHDE